MEGMASEAGGLEQCQGWENREETSQRSPGHTRQNGERGSQRHIHGCTAHGLEDQAEANVQGPVSSEPVREGQGEKQGWKPGGQPGIGGCRLSDT